MENNSLDNFFRGHVIPTVQQFKFILSLRFSVRIRAVVARHDRGLSVTNDRDVKMFHEIFRYFVRRADYNFVDVLDEKKECREI